MPTCAYMPTALPGISITTASQLLQEQGLGDALVVILVQDVAVQGWPEVAAGQAGADAFLPAALARGAVLLGDVAHDRDDQAPGQLRRRRAAQAGATDEHAVLLERRHIERVLAAENGHVERAAVRLGIPRSTLYQKIKSLGIAPSKV